MKRYVKWVLVCLAFLVILEYAPRPTDAIAQSGNYFMSLFVRQRIVMSPDANTSTQSAEVYFYDTGTYMYASSDGNLEAVSDGGFIIDAADSLVMDIGTPVVVFKSMQLDSGVSGANYDSLLIVLGIGGSTGGTADYDSIWIPILSTGL